MSRSLPFYLYPLNFSLVDFKLNNSMVYNTKSTMYTVSGKSLRYSMSNFNKFKYIFVFQVLAATLLFPVIVVAITWPHLSSCHDRKCWICHWNFDASCQSQRYKYFRFRQPFPVVGHYWNCLRTRYSSLPRSKTPGSPLEFWWYLSYFRRYKYFRFG